MNYYASIYFSFSIPRWVIIGLADSCYLCNYIFLGDKSLDRDQLLSCFSPLSTLPRLLKRLDHIEVGTGITKLKFSASGLILLPTERLLFDESNSRFVSII